MIDGTKVIDFHGHVGRWDKYGMIDDPALFLHAMDAVGIDVACLFNIFHPDGATANDLAARFIAQHPDRFVGFAYVSPLMPERMLPELARAIDELKFVAIKLYPPYTPWPLNQAPWHPIYQFAHERGQTIIFHTGPEPQSLPKFVGEIAPHYPQANFVIGHSGNTPDERTQAIAAAQANPNVYLETCSTFRTPGVIEQLVNEAGADRVLYGSDMPLMDPRSQIGKIITATISDEAKRQILGSNACRLLGL
ncbi:MAG: amidohydrolase family protein [Chloroflexi bacterium]|nr:amidohydrolase family protein [Chloroflexota bacterium]